MQGKQEGQCTKIKLGGDFRDGKMMKDVGIVGQDCTCRAVGRIGEVRTHPHRRGDYERIGEAGGKEATGRNRGNKGRSKKDYS